MSTSYDADRLARLEQQIQEIITRMAALESAGGAGAVTAPAPARAATPAAAASGAAPEPAAGNGAEAVLTYSGEGRFGPHQLMIRTRSHLAAVLDSDPDVVSQVFAALASPVRLTLLRAMVAQPCSSQQLRELLDAGSAGQLYHHLRELLAAGLVTQPGRSVYAIPRDKVVAICVALTAAVHLMPNALRVPLPPGPPDQEEAGPGEAVPGGPAPAGPPRPDREP